MFVVLLNFGKIYVSAFLDLVYFCFVMLWNFFICIVFVAMFLQRFMFHNQFVARLLSFHVIVNLCGLTGFWTIFAL